MAGCDQIRVPDVSRAHYELFLQRGAQMGLPAPAGQGDSGEAKQSGVTVRWEYRPDEKALYVQCTEAPMLLPCTMINTRIQEVIASVMKQDVIKAQQA